MGLLSSAAAPLPSSKICMCVLVCGSVCYSTPAHTPEGIDLQVKFRDTGLDISVSTFLQLSFLNLAREELKLIILVYYRNGDS